MVTAVNAARKNNFLQGDFLVLENITNIDTVRSKRGRFRYGENNKTMLKRLNCFSESGS
jgi:hypothetical protein